MIVLMKWNMTLFLEDFAIDLIERVLTMIMVLWTEEKAKSRRSKDGMTYIFERLVS